MPINKVKIFPSIGIARLGNSPSFFIGSEIIGRRDIPTGGYKDNRCRVKRQAGRFRLFAYDGSTLVGEITATNAISISWTAHLANKKGSWRRFVGLVTSPTGRNGLSGAAIGNSPPHEIDPGSKTVTGANQAAGFNGGQFLGRTVPLGEMRTDTDARLLILGGRGHSGSVPSDQPIGDYANNDNWYDDTSDGPVTATVVLDIAGTPTTFTADPAWVICAPPDFAPPVDSATTLFDMLLQVAIDNGYTIPASQQVPSVPSFTQHVYPILQRIFSMGRVNIPAAHSSHSDFNGSAAAAMSASRRQSVFNSLRDPDNLTSTGTMPKLWDDSNALQLTLTKTQYAIIQKWTGTAGVDWSNDWPGSPPTPPTAVDLTQPESLTQAALDACAGGAFYPGIEAGWFLRDGEFSYSEAFRIDHTGKSAGDVTKQMAVPWQADFYKCNTLWWPSQRPDGVFPEGSATRRSWIQDIVPDDDPSTSGHIDMVNHWHKLGFVVEKGGALVEIERRVVCRSLTLVTDRSHFSEDEVNSLLSSGSSAVFPNSFYIIAEGFLPAELGITTASPSQTQLDSMAPAVTVHQPDGTQIATITTRSHNLLVQDASLPATLRQRFTFVYHIAFSSTMAFTAESQTVTLRGTKDAGAAGTFTTSGPLTLLKQPNPYMLDGATHWLSTDLRVFQITQGDTRFGSTMGGTEAAATSFLASVLNSFNALGPASHPFDTISEDQQASKLELSRSLSDGRRVFNFAITKVRYRGNVLDAQDVKIFFRMFTTAATGLSYNENATYRRSPGSDPISLLGLQGGHIVTIPCYGDARIDTTTNLLSSQTDNVNKRTLASAGANEVHGYFGCWLDFNQTTPRFPLQPSPVDGPWTTDIKSIQELIRGQHQCLVAEVYFQNDPIPANATPAGNDNLSQRNLAIVESDNPGDVATHTVQHTFEIKASHRIPQLAPMVVPARDDDVEFASVNVVPPGPDELMIRWNNLPRSTEMTLYMPDVDVDEILRYTGQNYEAVRLEKVDAHTLRCLSGDVTYVPLPFGRTRNIAALLTMELPDDIRLKQVFNVVIHQLSGRPRHVLGAFEFTVPVSTKSVLLEPEIRKLSVLRHIARAIPSDDQWRPVFDRYLGQIADRVRGFGGDPDMVEPSPDGTGVDEALARCTRLGWIYSLLLTLFVALVAIHPLGNYVLEIIVLIGLIVAAGIWHTRCTVSRCRWVIASILGLGLGAAGAALLTLLGLASRGPTVLILVALALGATVGLGTWWRCFRFRRD